MFLNLGRGNFLLFFCLFSCTGRLFEERREREREKGRGDIACFFCLSGVCFGVRGCGPFRLVVRALGTARSWSVK